MRLVYLVAQNTDDSTLPDAHVIQPSHARWIGREETALAEIALTRRAGQSDDFIEDPCRPEHALRGSVGGGFRIRSGGEVPVAWMTAEPFESEVSSILRRAPAQVRISDSASRPPLWAS